MRVVLYTKEDCGLCENAEQALVRAMPRFGFDLERVFIDNDSELLAAYGDRVPVVMLDSREVAAAPINEAGLLAALSRAADARHKRGP